MTTEQRRQTISGLISEINEFRTMILYYENRIIRKQIAVSELLTGIEDGQPVEAQPAPPPPVAAPPHPTNPTVSEVLHGFIQFQGDKIFGSADAARWGSEKYPAIQAKIKRGIYMAMNQMIRSKHIFRVPGGYTTKAPPQQQ